MSLQRFCTFLVLVIVGMLAQVSVASANTAVNETSVAIPSSGTVVPAPSVEMRAPGTVASVSVSLNGLSHQYPDDLDIALESPGGQFVKLMSDACGSAAVSSLELTFALVGSTLSDTGPCGPGSYATADYEVAADVFSTAPGATFAPNLSVYNGSDPNGTWKLHIADDFGGFNGSLTSWELDVTTEVDPSLGYTRLPATGSGGLDSPAVVMTKQMNLPRAIADVDVVLQDLTHMYGSDLDVLLVSPAGTAVLMLSDHCTDVSFLRAYFRFDDAAPASLPVWPDIAACQASSATIKPSDGEPIETAITGAPAGPYLTSLSAFNGQFATGTWTLYLRDVFPGGSGYIKDFELAITQVPTKQLKVGRTSLKFKKSGKSRILASGRVPLSGATLATGECAGTARTTFQTKSTRKKGKKRITVYKRVAAANSRLRLVKGKCGVAVSTKLAKKYSGKKLRLVVDYRGGDYLSPFKRNLSVKVKRLKFR